MAGNINFEVLGLDRLFARFSSAAPKIREEVAAELYAFGWDVMKASLEIVPWKTGAWQPRATSALRRTTATR